MSRTRKRRNGRRKRNPGWFRRGHDSRRHELTHVERWSGYVSTYLKYSGCPDWLRWRICSDHARAENRRPPW